MWLLAIAGKPQLWSSANYALPLTLAACWALHAFAIANCDEPKKGWRLYALQLLGYVSACNFMFASPLHHTFKEHTQMLMVCKFATHGGALMGAVTAIVYYGVFVPTYEAWGCYPPTKSLAEHNHGMCGTNPNYPGPGWWVIPGGRESRVCDMVQQYTHFKCTPPVSPAEAFGSALAIASTGFLTAVAAYALGCLFAWEASLDRAE